MPVEVEGTTYHLAADVAEQVGVSRQTLWRWRQGGKVPRGRKYRGREVVFTMDELAEIRRYANRMEPLDEPAKTRPLKLFSRADGSPSEG